MRAWRYALVTAGVLLLLYGALELVASPNPLHGIALWLVGIVVIHDGIIAPLVVAIGWLLARFVAPRERRYVQAALISGALVTAIAIPLVLREDTKDPAKAWLLQNYGANLAILLGLIAVLNVGMYAATVARDRRQAAPEPEQPA